ncbi:MAG TPA: hypothetical protein EYP30_01430, partial [Archaeoglobaceae archaeon]|nr:hypothetical protein [Archaeoglobaceae archaeon]
DGFEPEDQNEVTRKFTETLDEIGFPRCKGNVMVFKVLAYIAHTIPKRSFFFYLFTEFSHFHEILYKININRIFRPILHEE